jgi:hypothetical protein
MDELDLWHLEYQPNDLWSKLQAYEILEKA